MAARPAPTPSVGEDLVVWVLGAMVGLAAAVWAGAQLAVLATTGHHLPAGLGAAMRAGLRLPSHAGTPAAAWPAEVAGHIPGPYVYWPATALAAVAMVVVVAGAHRLLAGPGPGTERRRRLGVDTRARLARPRDLAPLLVRRPQPGRLIVGRVGRRLVATERRASGRRQRGRRGDRSAVAVIGPTRCGKTANMISGILEWEGPAILSSVRDDLLEATLARRRSLGEVKVFDPTGVSGEATTSWSPLRDAATPTGAQKAARSLLAAFTKPGGGREDVEFFGDLGTPSWPRCSTWPPCRGGPWPTSCAG
ncbi:MAG TPA: type IV secretory system conjugative DNA transfer family protein [Acidimicrobiales bacterium]|nr:type IV secretory system conjugative DNA transfer family protein [Acidimicrobiales bacterium]